MKQILEEIRPVPGVIGGFIYTPREGIRASSLPTVFKTPKLENIGKFVARMFSLGRTSFPDILDLSLYYEESLLMIRELDHGIFLILLGDPSLNMNLLTMTLNLITDDLSQFTGTETPESAPEGDTTPSPEADRALPAEGPLADLLRKMEKALTGVIGPMARILFQDAQNDWVRQEPPAMETLPRLMEILQKEIDDPEKFRDYRKRIDSLTGTEERQYLWRGAARTGGS